MIAGTSNHIAIRAIVAIYLIVCSRCVYVFFSEDAPFNLINFGFVSGALHIALFSALISRTFRHKMIDWNATLVFLVALIALISCLWAESPLMSFGKAITWSISVFAGLTLGRTISRENLHSTLVVFAQCTTLISAILMTTSGLSFHQGDVHDGAFRGGFAHKNDLGKVISLCVVIFISDFIRPMGISEKNRIIRNLSFAGAIVGLSMILMSDSKSALAIAIAGGMVVFLASIKTQLIRHVAFTLLAASVCFVLINQDYILNLLERNRSLTGRTALWETSLYYIDQSPFWGYGFRSFWDPNSTTAAAAWSGLGWNPIHSHSSYIDSLLSFGFIGSIPLFYLLFRTIKKAACDSSTSVCYLGILLILLCSSVVEDVLLQNNHIYAFLICAIYGQLVGPISNESNSEIRSAWE